MQIVSTIFSWIVMLLAGFGLIMILALIAEYHDENKITNKEEI